MLAACARHGEWLTPWFGFLPSLITEGDTAASLVLFAGVAFMGMGIQYQNCFQRRLLDPEDTSYREGFEELAS